MKRYNYPDYLVHKNQHDALSIKIESVGKEFQEGKLGISIELMNFLRDWVKIIFWYQTRNIQNYLPRMD